MLRRDQVTIKSSGSVFLPADIDIMLESCASLYYRTCMFFLSLSFHNSRVLERRWPASTGATASGQSGAAGQLSPNTAWVCMGAAEETSDGTAAEGTFAPEWKDVSRVLRTPSASHPSIKTRFFLSSGWQGSTGVSPSRLRRKAGDTLDKAPVHCRAAWRNTKPNLERTMSTNSQSQAKTKLFS